MLGSHHCDRSKSFNFKAVQNLLLLTEEWKVFTKASYGKPLVQEHLKFCYYMYVSASQSILTLISFRHFYCKFVMKCF